MQRSWMGLLWTQSLGWPLTGEMEGPFPQPGAQKEVEWQRGWDCPKFSDRVDDFSCRERQRSVGEERFGEIPCHVCHQRPRPT